MVSDDNTQVTPEHPDPTAAPKKGLSWRVYPVGRSLGRRIGGSNAAIARREDAPVRKGKRPQHHIDPSIDHWEGMIS